MLSRREMLRTAGAAALAVGLSGIPLVRAAPNDRKKKKRILVYTRSQGFQHSVVEANHHRPSLVDAIWTMLATRHGFDVECTKDGRVFVPETLDKFDAFFFYTTGDLTKEKQDPKNTDTSPPMPPEGKKALLDAVAAGKGFIGSHCASDTFHSPGEKFAHQSPENIDPYIAMLGGEFIRHGDQQPATMHIADPAFPGLLGVLDFRIQEEWYTLKNFQPDLHVILVQETAGMKNEDYQRPPFPATWARMHGKGRVFYTSLGHREDVWTNPIFQNLLVGAVSWATGLVDAKLTPNMKQAAPEAMKLPSYAPKKK